MLQYTPMNPYLRQPDFPRYETLGDRSGAGLTDPATADAIIAFDFGDGGYNSDGELRPGFANIEIARFVVKHATAIEFEQKPGRPREVVRRATKPIFVQTLVAQALLEMCPELEITVVGTPSGEDEYVDSWKVATDAHEQAQDMSFGRIAIAAVKQHAKRVGWQTQKAFDRPKGLEEQKSEVFIPEGLPQTYADPDSTQEWTKRPFAFHLHPKKFFENSWWPREMVARTVAFLRGGPIQKAPKIA